MKYANLYSLICSSISNCNIYKIKPNVQSQFWLKVFPSLGGQERGPSRAKHGEAKPTRTQKSLGHVKRPFES